ncbi:hypothetical protein BH24ACI5_BH24ACI5_12510 [soil metagenome]
MPGVRDDGFAGEVLLTLEDAGRHASHGCLDEYGLRRHSRTQRRPLEHFRTEELPVLQPAPTTPYDIPTWSTPKEARDQLASVGNATYSLPHRYVGQVLTARADTQTVRFYVRDLVVKTHARQPPGGQALDPHGYPAARSVYALRNVTALQQQADQAGPAIGRFAAALLDSPLPWTRMRRVYALLGLVRRHGPTRVTEVGTVALAADMLDVQRLRRMLEHGLTTPPPAPPPRARYLRPAHQYALPFRAAPSPGEESS